MAGGEVNAPRWGTFFKSALQKDPARAFLAAFGVMVTLASLAMAGYLQWVAFLSGVGCVLAATLIPRLAKLKVGQVLEIDTRDADEGKAAVDLAQYYEEAPGQVALTPGEQDPVESIRSSDTSLPTPSVDDDEVTGYLNWSMACMAFQALVEWLQSDPNLKGSTIRLYLMDERGLLAPSLNADESSSEWAHGIGATGMAWARREYVAAQGEAVWDSTFNLPDGSRERFGHLTAVSSTPVFNRAGSVIGVLTASTSEPNPTLTSADGREILTVGAVLASRLLIGLLQWFDDEG